jgi:lipopolysaccharide/colanic/teichoic acid biosynthesis glycosyltransferase
MQVVTDWHAVVHFGALVTYPRAKRILDIVLALLILVLLAPVMAVIALLIVLDSPGPILHRQSRVGWRGNVFGMLKFRSMVVNADERPHLEYVVSFINGVAARLAGDGAALYKLAGDRRVSPFGRWLRRTSLDELPQVWNVLRGEMSLVGPRPPLPYEVEHYQPAHLLRLAARPGITGHWQVHGRGRTTFDEMVALDCEYIRRQSLALDLSILLKTIPVVLFAKDAR